jgi:radial spoke head protein 4/6
VIAPAGYFQVSEAGDIEPASDEPAILSAQQLADLGSWVHFSKEINAAYGRMTPMPAQTNSEGEEVPWEGEEFVAPLRSLAEDTAGTWRLDRYPATLIPAVGEFAVARSLVWPGAVSIAVGKKFLNVYVGHGVKFSAEPYQRPLPKPLQTGFGVATAETDGDAAADAKPSLRFEGLTEQKDVLEDPTPPDAEEE